MDTDQCIQVRVARSASIPFLLASPGIRGRPYDWIHRFQHIVPCLLFGFVHYYLQPVRVGDLSLARSSLPILWRSAYWAVGSSSVVSYVLQMMSNVAR